MSAACDVVTGAFGFSGQYIARRLVAMGRCVRTLTNHGRPDVALEVLPYHFDDPDRLAQSLQGVQTLYNTYWIRFPRGRITYQQAVANSCALIDAARRAGVRRIVHISVSHAAMDSAFPYFRGKAEVEKAIIDSGLPYAILRPAMVFGPGDILVNNIAWHLRRLPVFAVFGDGSSLVQPIFVDDLAELAVEAGSGADSRVIEAGGPDIMTFEQMVRLIAQRIGSRSGIIHLSPSMALRLTRWSGLLLGDVVLTADEVGALMANLLVTQGPPAGRMHLGDWLEQNRDEVGAEYHSELKRHYR